VGPVYKLAQVVDEQLCVTVAAAFIQHPYNKVLFGKLCICNNQNETAYEIGLFLASFLVIVLKLAGFCILCF